MAGLCEKTGSYSLATAYASLKYTYSGDVEDLARCAEDGILSGNNSNVLNYCEKLVSDENFDELCAKKDEEFSSKADNFSYRQYVFGNLAAAKFKAGKTEEAISSAKTAMDGAAEFSKNNAYAILATTVCAKGDKAAAALLLTELQSQNYQGEYFASVTNALNKTAEKSGD